jgi:GT2 family glycosyltransferase
MKLGAVIVTHNSAATITACLQSLQAAGVEHIIVVDNASTDNTISLIQNRSIQLIRQTTNKGFAQAANQGARLLTEPYIFFLNPDAVLENPHQLSPIIQELEHSPRRGAVGLLMHDERGQIEQRSFGSPVTFWSLFTRHINHPFIPQEVQPVGWVSAGALIVRRSAFNAVQAFDKNFFLYWEDVDICRRLQAAHWQVVLEPRAKIRHQRGASLRNQQQKTIFYDRGADKYFRKHYPTTIWLLQRFCRRIYRLFSPQAQ